MEKVDNRYKTAAKLYKLGGIKDLDDLFEVIPCKDLAHRVGYGKQRTESVCRNPIFWSLVDLILIGILLEIDVREMMTIVVNQIEKNKVKR